MIIDRLPGENCQELTPLVCVVLDFCVCDFLMIILERLYPNHQTSK
jgi:hypothetical protein